MAIEPTSEWSKDSVAVVTGANKGIGLEIVRLLAEHGLTVVLTARDKSRGEAALAGLKEKGLTSVVFHPLNLSDADSINSLASWLKSEFGGIDILVNNAGITATSFDYDSAKNTVDTNYFAPKNLTKALLPLFRASPNGARIVNATTRMALYDRLQSNTLKQKFKDEDKYSEQYADSLATDYLEDVKAGRAEESWVINAPGKGAIYSESKMFLNVYAAYLGKSLAQSQPKGYEIFVGSFCPGVTATDMMHEFASAGFELPEGFHIKTPAEGADTAVWLALLPKTAWPEKSGKFFGERNEYSFGWENPPF